MSDEAKPEAPAPGPQNALQPSALANLATLQAEEDDDTELAGEIDKEAQAAASLLTVEERNKAAEKGALLAVGFAETLVNMGMKITSVDDSVQTKVKAEIEKAKAGILKDMQPVLLKYNAEPPAIIANVMNEIMLAFKLLMLGISIYVAIRDGSKKAPAAKEEKPSPELLPA